MLKMTLVSSKISAINRGIMQLLFVIERHSIFFGEENS